MKLPQLLSQFLYQNKTLRLPGIGIFTLDPQAVIPDAGDKDLPTTASGIEFENKTVYEPDNDLIEFIRSHTGKMKALAAADLESYLALGIQLLNIGKPFYLEGIGTLSKTVDGRFEFARGEYSTVRMDDPVVEKKKPIFEETHYDRPSSQASRKGLLVFLILAGLAIVGGGGYLLYKKNVYTEPEKEVTIVKADTPVPVHTDTTRSAAVKPDSVSQPHTDSLAVAATPAADSVYKFIILETTNKFKALRRYNQLLSYDLNVKLYQKDSVFFKVYFSFPAQTRDTAHIKDSLDNYYATRTIIEK